MKSVIKRATYYLRPAQQGCRLWDKALIVALGLHCSLDPKRKLAHKLILAFLMASTRPGRQLRLQCLIENQKAVFYMRHGNSADYCVTGEILKGTYSKPSFTPKQIIDAGANIGSFTAYAAALFPGVPITCYEPDDDNGLILRQNIPRNGLLLKKGVWSHATTLFYHKLDGSHLGYIDETPPGQELAVELPEIGEDCWLKIDAEGAEYKVLPELLKKKIKPRWISLELHLFGANGRALLDKVLQAGYICSDKEKHQLDSTCAIFNLELATR